MKKFIRFEKSKNKNKKYDAILLNKKTGRINKISFGAIRPSGEPYPQFKDRTGLGLYTKYNHNDKLRRERYYRRFGKKAVKYTAKWFSHKYLW